MPLQEDLSGRPAPTGQSSRPPPVGHQLAPARYRCEGVSILDPARLAVGALTGYREITDAYLLALAVSQSGALATLDGGIRLGAAVGAEPRRVAVLGR